MKTLAVTQPVRLNKYLPVIAIIGLFILGLYIFSTLILKQPAIDTSHAVIISTQVLEEKYGLRVNLLAVTAAGGMVDLRLKILDGEKARLLLQEKKNFPTLLVNDGKTRLNVDEDTQSQQIKFEDNGGLYLIFPNSGNAVKSGSAVSVVFGDVQLEPVDAQ